MTMKWGGHGKPPGSIPRVGSYIINNIHCLGPQSDVSDYASVLSTIPFRAASSLDAEMALEA